MKKFFLLLLLALVCAGGWFWMKHTAPAAPDTAAPPATPPQTPKIQYSFPVMQNSGIPRITEKNKAIHPFQYALCLTALHRAVQNDCPWTVRYLLERNIFGGIESNSRYSSSGNYKNYRSLVEACAKNHPSVRMLAFLLENTEMYGMKKSEWNDIYDQLLPLMLNRKERYLLPLFGYFASHGIHGSNTKSLNNSSNPLAQELLFIRNNPPPIDTNAVIVQKLPAMKSPLRSGLPKVAIPEKKLEYGKQWNHCQQLMENSMNNSHDFQLEWCRNVEKVLSMGYDINAPCSQAEGVSNIIRVPLNDESFVLACFMIENGADPKVINRNGYNLIDQLVTIWPAPKDLAQRIIYFASHGVPIRCKALNLTRSREIYELLLKLREETGPHWDDHLINNPRAQNNWQENKFEKTEVISNEADRVAAVKKVHEQGAAFTFDSLFREISKQKSSFEIVKMHDRSGVDFSGKYREKSLIYWSLMKNDVNLEILEFLLKEKNLPITETDLCRAVEYASGWKQDLKPLAMLLKYHSDRPVTIFEQSKTGRQLFVKLFSTALGRKRYRENAMQILQLLKEHGATARQTEVSSIWRRIAGFRYKDTEQYVPIVKLLLQYGKPSQENLERLQGSPFLPIIQEEIDK